MQNSFEVQSSMGCAKHAKRLAKHGCNAAISSQIDLREQYAAYYGKQEENGQIPAKRLTNVEKKY